MPPVPMLSRCACRHRLPRRIVAAVVRACSGIIVCDSGLVAVLSDMPPLQGCRHLMRPCSRSTSEASLFEAFTYASCSHVVPVRL